MACDFCLAMDSKGIQLEPICNKSQWEIRMRAIFIVLVLLLSMNAAADVYTMGQLREAVKAESYNISSNYVRGSTEMWMLMARHRSEDSPTMLAAARKCTTNDSLTEVARECVSDLVIKATANCINDFLSGVITWELLDQNDKYPDDWPVAIVIEDILSRCLFTEVSK